VLLGVVEWRTYEEVVISCARHDCAKGGMWKEEGVREGARGGLEGSRNWRYVASDAAGRNDVTECRREDWGY
jgi:hypothetical protein